MDHKKRTVGNLLGRNNTKGNSRTRRHCMRITPIRARVSCTLRRPRAYHPPGHVGSFPLGSISCSTSVKEDRSDPPPSAAQTCARASRPHTAPASSTRSTGRTTGLSNSAATSATRWRGSKVRNALPNKEST